MKSNLIMAILTTKTPKIPPIRSDRNILVSDVSEKASIFNSYFAKQCSLIDTGSILPPEQFLTGLRLENLEFNEDKIESLINSLNVSKAHGWHDISARMVKICGKSLVKPLYTIFNLSLSLPVSSLLSGKKAMLILFIKKGTKVLLKIIGQYLCFQYLANFLRSASTMHFTIILQAIIFFLLASLGFVRVILVFLSCCP